MLKCVGGITWSKHAQAQSQFWEFETKCHLESLILPSSVQLKPTCDIRIIHFYYTRAALAWTKKKPKINVHLEMRNLSRTEERMAEDKTRRRNKKL